MQVIVRYAAHMTCPVLQILPAGTLLLGQPLPELASHWHHEATGNSLLICITELVPSWHCAGPKLLSCMPWLNAAHHASGIGIASDIADPQPAMLITLSKRILLSQSNAPQQ